MSLEQQIDDLRDDLAAVADQLRRIHTPVTRLAWTVKEAAERVGVSDSTMRDLIAAGRVEAVTYSASGRLFVPDWSLRELVREPGASRPSLEAVREAS